MSLELFDSVDVASSFRSDVKDSAALSDVYGLIVRERQYSIADAKSLYNPFAAGSELDRIWRNGNVVETDSFGGSVYSGRIFTVGYEYTDTGRTTQISARDSFGIIKDWSVEEYLLKSGQGLTAYYTVQVNRARQFAGNITYNTTGAPPAIAIGDIVSFEPDIVPRYQVVGVIGGAIQLDRPLEYAITAGQRIRVMSPVIKTGPLAVRDALLAAGVTNLGTSFSVLHAADLAAGRTLRLFVRKEQKVKLTEHLNKVMDMTDLFLTVNADGQVNVIRGLQYDGLPIEREITDSEIILPLRINFESARLLYGYDLLYLGANAKVAVQSNIVSNELLTAYAARDRWQPVSAASESPLEYQYLYSSQASAAYFGSRKLDYYGRPRVRVSFALKQFPSGRPNAPYKLSVGDKFLLTCSFGGGKGFTRQPAIVTAYEYDDETQHYPRVEVELNNYLFPELPVPA